MAAQNDEQAEPRFDIIGVAASAGCLRALASLISSLPGDITDKSLPLAERATDLLHG